jgi:citrate lyase alpha subunit
MKRPDGLGIGSIESPAAIAAHMDKANIVQDAEVLRDGGLLHVQCCDDVTDGAILQHEKVQYFPSARFSDCVERI